MSSQHTIPTAIAGELTQTPKNGERTDSQSMHEGKICSQKNCGKITHRRKPHHARLMMKQQIVPQSRNTSNTGQQWSLLNDEANAPFIVGNGGVNAGSMHDQEEGRLTEWQNSV